MSERQEAHGRCVDCDRVVRYVQRDPWAFDWACAYCGACGVVCWSTKDPAPAPAFDPTTEHPSLFTETP